MTNTHTHTLKIKHGLYSHLGIKQVQRSPTKFRVLQGPERSKRLQVTSATNTQLDVRNCITGN